MALASFLFHKSDYRLMKSDSLISIIVNNSRNDHGANVSKDCPTLFFVPVGSFLTTLSDMSSVQL